MSLAVLVVMIMLYIAVKGTSSLAVIIFSLYPRYFYSHPCAYVKPRNSLQRSSAITLAHSCWLSHTWFSRRSLLHIGSGQSKMMRCQERVQGLTFRSVAWCDKLLKTALVSTDSVLMPFPEIPSTAVISRIFHLPSGDALTWNKFHLEITVVFPFPSIFTV